MEKHATLVFFLTSIARAGMEQIVSVLPDKAFHYREVLAISFMAALVRHHVHQLDFILIF